MQFILLRRAIKNGLVNFWRNIWLSTAATLIMVITLTILTLTTFIVSFSNYAIHNVQARVDVSVYFSSQASPAEIDKIQNDVSARPEVSSINYISADQALATFKDKHAEDAVITESLTELGDNPLPATLQIKAKNLDQYATIVSFLSTDQYKPYISKINFDDNRAVIERLSHILSTLKKVGISLAVVFALLAILVIFNTIRLTIYNRREEVEIMRLVGATNWYIRWPFLIESITYALLSSMITAVILLPVFHYVIPRVNDYLGTGAQSSPSFRFVNIGYLFVAQLIVALFLGIVSSFVAMRRYLKV